MAGENQGRLPFTRSHAHVDRDRDRRLFPTPATRPGDPCVLIPTVPIAAEETRGPSTLRLVVPRLTAADHRHHEGDVVGLEPGDRGGGVEAAVRRGTTRRSVLGP